MNYNAENGSPVDANASDAKRERMLAAALTVFVANGYVGTSTDQLAAAAAVSKNTLYTAFGDKEGIFAALIHSACDRVGDPFAPLEERMQEARSAEDAVRLLAEKFAHSIMRPSVQELRRLVIAEATRFPELALLYWERGFLRVMDSVDRCLQILDDRRLLVVPDIRLAGQHFAGMLLWIPSNQVMFAASSLPIAEDELERVIATGSAAFLRAYRP